MNRGEGATGRGSAQWAGGALTGACVLVPPILVWVGWLPPAVCLVSAGIVLSWLLWALRPHAAAIALVFVATAFLLTAMRQPWPNLRSPTSAVLTAEFLAQRWAGAGPFDETLPVVLHIVLDELMSPGAVDRSLPGADAYLEAVSAFGRKHGLRMYDAVYARFFFSGVSIPNMMNAEYRGRTGPREISTDVLEELPENEYFRDMADRGYRTAVFDTAVLRLCGAPDVRLCETFPSYDPGVATAATDDDRTQAVYLWDTLLRTYVPSYTSSWGLSWIRYRYGLDQHGLGMLGTSDRFDVQGFPQWFDRFARFVTAAPRGAHIVGHFLVPHSPYLLTEACLVSGEFDSGYYLAMRFPDDDQRRLARRRYYAAYFRQARCVLSKLDDLLDAMAMQPALRDARILIHGDHGSRISVGNVADDYAPADLLDNYAAFFAARGGGLAAGIDCTLVSLPQLFRALSAPTPAPVPLDRLPVIARTSAGEDVRVELPMPVFGCAAP